MHAALDPVITRFLCASTALAFVIAAVSGCAANSPLVQDRLKMVSAGHTGCMPEENVISNVASSLDGTGTWNATCKGKVYLCSAAPAGNAEAYSCAPAAQ